MKPMLDSERSKLSSTPSTEKAEARGVTEVSRLQQAGLDCLLAKDLPGAPPKFGQPERRVLPIQAGLPSLCP